MQVPSVMFIESAADTLKSDWGTTEWVKTDQQKELTSFGDSRAQGLGATGLSDDFRKGYELGLQTARAVLLQSGALVLKGIDPKQVL